jgi:hypothetical protein
MMVAVPLGTVQAFDFGGSLHTGLQFSLNQEPVFRNGETLTLWVGSRLGSSSQIKAQAHYRFSTELEPDTVEPYFFDLDLLHFSGTYPLRGGRWPVLTVDAGRYTFNDFSGNVLSHTLDGVSVGVLLPFATVDISAGTTALLRKESSDILVSKYDIYRNTEDDYVLAPPRIIGLATLTFVEPFLRQDLSLSTILQFDVSPRDELISEGLPVFTADLGGRVNTQYYGIGVEGPIIGPLYWDSFFYAETGSLLSYTGTEYQEKSILGFLAGGSLRLFLEDGFHSMIELSGLYASGDADARSAVEGNQKGKSRQFLPIDSPALGKVFSPLLGNILSTSLHATLKPFFNANPESRNNIVEFAITGTTFFRPSTGPISVPHNTESDKHYLGTEVDTEMTIRPFSDMGVVLSGGLFFPNRGEGKPFTEDQQKAVSYKGTFELSFRF